eukprot:1391262-Amorphochlora_amoeboformis.AAC.1
MEVAARAHSNLCLAGHPLAFAPNNASHWPVVPDSGSTNAFLTNGNAPCAAETPAVQPNAWPPAARDGLSEGSAIKGSSWELVSVGCATWRWLRLATMVWPARYE